MKKCPYCAEEIQDDAIKCKHCGERLDKNAKERTKSPILEEKIIDGGLFSFQGRIGRLDYFLTKIGLIIIYMIGILILLYSFGILGTNIDNVKGNLSKALTGISFIIIFFSIIITFLYINIALTVKRFHDLDMSGWYYLILFIPLINVIFGLILLFAKGTKGTNRFGIDPSETNTKKIQTREDSLNKNLVEIESDSNKELNTHKILFNFFLIILIILIIIGFISMFNK